MECHRKKSKNFRMLTLCSVHDVLVSSFSYISFKGLSSGSVILSVVREHESVIWKKAFCLQINTILFTKVYCRHSELDEEFELLIFASCELI